MTEIITPNWKMKSISISFQEYGDYKGQYVGKIEYNNNENEAFMFKLYPEECQHYMKLISEKLVQSASHLGDKLLASLNLLPAPKEIIIQTPAQPEPENPFDLPLPF